MQTETSAYESELERTRRRSQVCRQQLEDQAQVVAVVEGLMEADDVALVVGIAHRVQLGKDITISSRWISYSATSSLKSILFCTSKMWISTLTTGRN